MKKWIIVVVQLMATLLMSCETDSSSTKLYTGDATDITASSATLHCIINLDRSKYAHVEVGVIVSPNKSEIKKHNGEYYPAAKITAKQFELNIKDLSANTEYYYCTYALLNHTLYKFGSIKQFITAPQNTDNQSTNYTAKAFSVGTSKQVHFSRGNLQYHPKNNQWRFAPSQLDYISYSNNYISPTYDGWIDLFGWGTGDNPTNASTNIEDYPKFVDWGSNVIDEEAPNTWRTLTLEEWVYVLSYRKNASFLQGVAMVDGVAGFIILPDYWICPDQVNFKSGFFEGSYVNGFEFHQKIDKQQWALLERSGAIFFPASGFRGGTTVHNVGHLGFYWSSMRSLENYVYRMCFDSGQGIIKYGLWHYYGCAVRLVKDL